MTTVFGWFQFLWGWTGAEPDQWPWYDPEQGTKGHLVFYGIALGETFIGIVR